MTEKTVSEQLYDAMTEAVAKGWSILRIAEKAGISRPSLQRWYSGDRDSMAMDTINNLCQFFGMRLTKAKIPKLPADVREPRRKPKSKEAKPKE